MFTDYPLVSSLLPHRTLRRGLLSGLAPLMMASCAPPAQSPPDCPAPSDVAGGFSGPLADVRYLADDALEGREVGSQGARCASEYLASRFDEMGLEPAGINGGWFHTFPVRVGTDVDAASALEIPGRTLELGTEWTPMGFSSGEPVNAPLAYGGYGPGRPGTPEDADAHTDLDGRIVVLEAGDPDAPNSASIRAAPHFKATVAQGRGAVGVLVLLAEDHALPDPTTEIRGSLKIPVAVVAAGAADVVRGAARQGLDASLHAAVRPIQAEARNVVALLPGADPRRRDELVVVGGHYDHLGHGGEGSLDPDSREIHNGADDNASGTAGVLEIARELTGGPPPTRSILFLAFTGEEKGLWGSAAFVRAPSVSLDHAVAMLNLDMVGRLRNDALTVFGTGTADEWASILERADSSLDAPLHMGYSPDGYGPSDHSSFYGAGIPVLHFFTNTHEDYHRPTDDWDKINADGIARVAELGARVVRILAGDPDHEPLDLHAVRKEPPPPPPEGEARRSYGPYLGTIPDMGPSEIPGLRLTGVREGSPAEKAGLQAGDVVVEFAGAEVTDIYSYSYALRDRKPGDVVKIGVLRDGRRLTLTAVLAERD